MNKKKLKDTSLGRSAPRRNIFHALTRKRHITDTGMVEDNAKSTTIIRVIVGLLIIHLALIGGALLRGHLKKGNGGEAMTATLTEPPAIVPQPGAASFPAAAAQTRQPGQHGPVNLAATQPQPAARPHTQAQNHITQTPALVDDDTADEVDAPARSAAGTVMVKHLVASGESWSSIAMANSTTVEALKAANPAAARKINPSAGTYIMVPVPKDSAQAKAEADRAAAAPQPKYHVVAKGESMGAIAKKYKMSLQKLIKLNNMTDKQAGKIKVGQKIKVSE